MRIVAQKTVVDRVIDFLEKLLPKGDKYYPGDIEDLLKELAQRDFMGLLELIKKRKLKKITVEDLPIFGIQKLEGVSKRERVMEITKKLVDRGLVRVPTRAGMRRIKRAFMNFFASIGYFEADYEIVRDLKKIAEALEKIAAKKKKKKDEEGVHRAIYKPLRKAVEEGMSFEDAAEYVKGEVPGWKELTEGDFEWMKEHVKPKEKARKKRGEVNKRKIRILLFKASARTAWTKEFDRYGDPKEIFCAISLKIEGIIDDKPFTFGRGRDDILIDGEYLIERLQRQKPAFVLPQSFIDAMNLHRTETELTGALKEARGRERDKMFKQILDVIRKDSLRGPKFNDLLKKCNEVAEDIHWVWKSKQKELVGLSSHRII